MFCAVWSLLTLSRKALCVVNIEERINPKHVKHVMVKTQMFVLQKEKYLLIGKSRSKIRLHALCSLIWIYSDVWSTLSTKDLWLTLNNLQVDIFLPRCPGKSTLDIFIYLSTTRIYVISPMFFFLSFFFSFIYHACSTGKRHVLWRSQRNSWRHFHKLLNSCLSELEIMKLKSQTLKDK